MSAGSDPMARELVEALRKAGIASVDGSTRRRAEYSSDASNYRVVPQAVAFPRESTDIEAALAVARELGTPVTMRGGGTSVAGNAVGPGLILDTSRHFNRVLSLNPESRTAVVQPGTILGTIQKLAAPHGLRFGPDPSTWARCSIGGMIGNNACGPRALAFGRTADNVIDLDVVDGHGRRFRTGSALEDIDGLNDLVFQNLDIFRTELGRFGRQISGYSLEHLLPEQGKNLSRALVGTEGTCVALLEATVRLVEIPREPVLVVLGYPDMAAAADAVPALIGHGAMAIEGLDARIVDAVRGRKGASAVPDLPDGSGWLLVEVADHESGDALAQARALVADADTEAVRVLPSSPEARAIWRIREDGAGLAGRTQSGRQAWPGIEDAAVPPENLGKYLRDFDRLTNSYSLEGMPYGHFGDGCVHVRLDIPLETDSTVLRSFMNDAAELIAGYGGSLAGEHGDGRARGELLTHMYSERMLNVFAAFKNIFDPADILNPGIIVRPAPLDQDLRRPAALTITRVNGLAFNHDDGNLTQAVHRCVGIGKCRADNAAGGGFMCPSYQATGDEKDSTRGRARVLQEVMNGTLVTESWRSPEVHEALDLCLSCKACSSDCPAGVDMAAFKSEVLHRSYEGRLRPLAHYSLGWMPRWVRLATKLGPILNAVVSVRALERLILFAGGMETQRSIPRFARTPFRAWWRRRDASTAALQRTKKVVLWADTFSDNFSPSIAKSAVDILETAGYEVIVPRQPVCCGLTWISTGQLTAARRRLGALVDQFHEYALEGIPVLGLEPSCTATVRADLVELLPDDPRAADVADNILTLTELLTAPPPIGPGDSWERPDLTGVTLVVQPHCHHHSVMGFGADQQLLVNLGAKTTILAGCCGLAGNFGMERGHYDVSVAVAENALLPALREADPGTVFLADGLSCRTQADQLAGAKGLHLAELLAEAMRQSS
ncbi:FAD-binding protein [Mycobacterium sp. CBMA293]|uniref:FAD-binding and (Fe-S)-binding domain-containing protein n=1 Tax=unclassified Mycolicibacterium TaxID=2636767 RepID=UPI0012DF9C5E|nr:MULTISPECIES: FAD-binding and (Fe-S)-binding domain-containing protein [unclassified Mycolicibacterium]MUL49401.1 FAD-binding protein [Mycolicibacterium sp. CBMA 360]MUL62577.1 FAD-binding protein [Mycolicibacterium sp. CBMA 335]MUL69029.1 FAD-binding protein [Mycolicibacterium sp. CBMA 311]MUL96968.1 FAD-binding protein [Mycolicibacterium sp. CBMA 230]MUM03994.1 FAD-binding oxidoreductase [Mycolicibacterium sp. CBMA 213]